jgi:CHAD domain-containing protein
MKSQPDGRACRGIQDDAAMIMSQRQRVDRISDPARPDLARELRPPLMLALPRVNPDDPAGHVIIAAFREAVVRLAASDPEARRGEPEGIHRLRTTTRRLRSELHALEILVEQPWSKKIEQELRWLAGRLGEVRDLDVLSARLKKAAGALNLSDAALAPIFETLKARHGEAAVALNDALRSDRYRGLVSALQIAAERPALRDAASEPCRAALPPAVAAAWRLLKKGGRDLRRSDPDEQFHELRKRAKRARYTAELIAPVMGRHIASAADRFIRLVTQVQNALGEHQDAVVAAHEIDQVLADHPRAPGFVEPARVLLESQHQAAQDARAAFFEIWVKLDRKKTRRWIKASTRPKAYARD